MLQLQVYADGLALVEIKSRIPTPDSVLTAGCDCEFTNPKQSEESYCKNSTEQYVLYRVELSEWMVELVLMTVV